MTCPYSKKPLTVYDQLKLRLYQTILKIERNKNANKVNVKGLR